MVIYNPPGFAVSPWVVFGLQALPDAEADQAQQNHSTSNDSSDEANGNSLAA